MRLRVTASLLNGLAGLVLTGFVLYKLYPSWLAPSAYLVGTVYDNTWIYAFPTRLAYNLAHDLPLRAYETIGYPLPLLQREIMPAMRALIALATALTSPQATIVWLTLGSLVLGGFGASYLFRVFKLPWLLALIGGLGYTTFLARDTNSEAGFLETGSMYFVSASLIPWFFSFLWQALEKIEVRSQKLDTSRFEVLLVVLLVLQTLVSVFILGPWLGLGWWTVIIPLGLLGLNFGLIRWLKRQATVPVRQGLNLMIAVGLFNLVLGLRIEMAYLLGLMAILVVFVGLLSGVFERRRFLPLLGVGLVQGVLSLWLPVYLLFFEPSGQGIGLSALENNRFRSLDDLRNFSPGLDFFINRAEPFGVLALIALVIGLVWLISGRKTSEVWDRNLGGWARRTVLFGLVFLLGVFLTIKPEVSILGFEVRTLPSYLFELGFQGLRRYGINHFSVFLFEWAAVASLFWLAFQGLGQGRWGRLSLLSLGLPSLLLLGLLIRFVPSPKVEVVHYPEAAEVYRWLAEQPEGAVIEYPLASVIDQVGQTPLFGQAYHRKPIINGLELKDYQLAVSLQKLDRYDLPLLQLLGAKYLVIHPQLFSQVTNWQTTDGKIWYFPQPPLDVRDGARFAKAHGLNFQRYFPPESGLEGYVFEVPDGPGFGQYGTLEVAELDLLQGEGSRLIEAQGSLDLATPTERGQPAEVTLRLERPERPGLVSLLIDFQPYLHGPSNNAVELFLSRDGKNFELIERKENGQTVGHRYPVFYGLTTDSLDRPVYLRYRLLTEPTTASRIDSRLEALKVRWYYAAEQ